MSITPVRSTEEELFLVQLAVAMQQAGLAADRLEDAVQQVGAALGIQAQAFAAPTFLTVDLGWGSRMLGVSNGDEQLARMIAIEALAREVAAGELEVPEARRRLEAIEAQPAPWSEALVVAAFAATSGAGAVLFGGGLLELLVSALSGLWIAVLARIAPPRLLLLLASASAATVGTLLPVDAEIVVLSACLVLLPGLSLTRALGELSENHLASGGARLARVFSVLLQLGVGTSLALMLPSTPPLPLPLPAAASGAALVLTGGAFMVLLQARLRDGLFILAVCLLAWMSWSLGAGLPPAVQALLGALAVGLASNLQARLRRVPPSVTLVPGLLLLVPGSVGFRAMDAFAASETLVGLEVAFSCVQTAAALAAGLALASALIPPRRRSASPVDYIRAKLSMEPTTKDQPKTASSPT